MRWAGRGDIKPLYAPSVLQLIGKYANNTYRIALGRRGYFFTREYDAAPVLTDEDFV
jgi:hypothetical protein